MPDESGQSRPTSLPTDPRGGRERGLFTLRPNGWFVFHESWPTCLAMAAVPVAAWAATRRWDVFTESTIAMASQACAGVMLLRLVWDLLTLAKTEFLLTDRRAAATSGPRDDPPRVLSLDEVVSVELSRSPLQRLTGTGTIRFRVEGIDAPMMVWPHVPDPADVHAAVEHAVRRARHDRERERQSGEGH